MTDQPSLPNRGNPFWDFSLRLYASPAVQKACLDLQDGSGVDVNVLLCMLWHGVNMRSLSNADAAALVAAVESWRVEVVVPLRTARRNLKTPSPAIDPAGAESLRAIVKKAELEAERLQQAALYNFKVAPGALTRSASNTPRTVASANVAAYALAIGCPLAAAPLGVILDALDAMVVVAHGSDRQPPA